MLKFAAIIIPLILLSCGKKDEEVVVFSDESDSALAVIKRADSTYTVRHANFDGYHNHGKDAASHAHQDVGRKKRILRNEAENFDARKKAYEAQKRKRMERLQGSEATDSTDTSTEVQE